ncbi:MAG: hypothetical protein HIU92_17380 [Proteobacteria bacterium]|nr:hypothetical protein [Pseudomonadota bacterium]
MSNDRVRMNADKSRASRLIRPGPLVVAAGILWAAANEPISFTPSSAAVWVLGGLTAALLARAALALLQPLAKLGLAALLNGIPRRGHNTTAGDRQ